MEKYAGRRKKKLRGDRQWTGRVYVGQNTDAGGYLFFSQVFEENLVSFASRWDPLIQFIYNADTKIPGSYFFLRNSFLILLNFFINFSFFYILTTFHRNIVCGIFIHRKSINIQMDRQSAAPVRSYNEKRLCKPCVGRS